MKVVDVIILVLVSGASVGCGKSEPETIAAPPPISIPEVVEVKTQMLPAPVDDGTLKLVDLQRRELREAQQLFEKIERELGEIRTRLESSNRQLQLKQQAVDSIQSGVSD